MVYELDDFGSAFVHLRDSGGRDFQAWITTSLPTPPELPDHLYFGRVFPMDENTKSIDPKSREAMRLKKLLADATAESFGEMDQYRANCRKYFLHRLEHIPSRTADTQ
jgi:hypothetical protein